MIFENFQTYKQKIVYAMQFLKTNVKIHDTSIKKSIFHIFIFKQYCRFLLNLIENSINRQLHFVQEFQNVKQRKANRSNF